MQDKVEEEAKQTTPRDTKLDERVAREPPVIERVHVILGTPNHLVKVPEPDQSEQRKSQL